MKGVKPGSPCLDLVNLARFGMISTGYPLVARWKQITETRSDLQVVLDAVVPVYYFGSRLVRANSISRNLCTTTKPSPLVLGRRGKT